jgi:hypothetical protein
MPTDLYAASARKRAQAQAQTEIAMLLFWVFVCFGMLGLVLEVFAR